MKAANTDLYKSDPKPNYPGLAFQGSYFNIMPTVNLLDQDYIIYLHFRNNEFRAYKKDLRSTAQ